MPASAYLYSWPLNFTTFSGDLAGDRVKFSHPEPGDDDGSMHIGLDEVPAISFVHEATLPRDRGHSCACAM